MSTPDGFSRDMNANASLPKDLDSDTAERLLSGRVEAADAPPSFGAVASVLAAASGSATQAELSDEAEAVAMYRSNFAQSQGGATSTLASLEGHRNRRVSRKAAAIGLAAGLVLATTSVAAASGGLPEPVQRAAHETLSRIGVSVPEPPPKPARPASPPARQSTSTTRPDGPTSTQPPRRDPQATPASTSAPPTSVARPPSPSPSSTDLQRSPSTSEPPNR